MMLNTLVCLAVTSWLAPPQDGFTSYQLKPNPKGLKSVRATALKVEEDRAYLRGIVDGETKEGWVDLKWFTDVSALRILRSGAAADDVESFLRVVRYGLEHGELEEAEKAWSAAQRASGKSVPDAELAAALDQRRAAQLEKDFHDAMYAGDLKRAQGALQKLERDYPSSPTAAHLPRMKQLLETQRATIEARQAAAAAQEADEKRTQSLETAQKYLARAQEAEKQGRSGEGTESQQRKHLESAVRSAEGAMQQSDRLIAQHRQNDPQLAASAKSLRGTAVQVRKNSLLDLGSRSLNQGNLNRALGYVNGILREDPNDADAKAMRGRIEEASNDGWWGYPPIVGRPRTVVGGVRR